MENVPTIEESFKRGFISKDVHDIKCNLNIDDLIVKDFDTRKTHRQLLFNDESTLFGRVSKKLMSSKPQVNKKECIGCEKCKNVCPAKAITMNNKIPQIDRKKCIKCFCCQEFCPKGAMKVKRPIVAKILEKI
jgi:ferredoxin